MIQSSKYLDVNPKLFVVGEIEYPSLKELYKILTAERFSKQPLFQVSLRDFAYEDSKNSFKTDHEFRIRNLIKQWEKSNIVSKRKGRGWQKHSFTELIWFRLIMKFREFGYPLNRVTNIYQKLMVASRNHSVLNNIALEIAGDKTNTEELPIDFEKKAMAMRFPGTKWSDEKISEFNIEIEKVEQTVPLADILVNVLAFGFPTFIITDGLNVQDIILHEELGVENSILFENHISINLNEIVSEFIDGDLNQIFISTWEKLDTQEKAVLNLVRTSKAKRIIFEFNSKQEISLIIEETTQTPTRLERQYLEELSKKKEYVRIIADLADGQLVNFERHPKTKPKK